jgi:hypothetical protein
MLDMLQSPCDGLAWQLPLLPVRRIIMPRFLNVVLMAATLVVPVTMVPTLRAEEHNNARTYHDKEHNDDHEWNSHEDQAYRIWAKENHRKYNNNFAKVKESDQQAYWGWRHEHSDTVLKIVIR